MSMPVSLDEVAGALEMVANDINVYLNRQTGEIVQVRSEEADIAESGAPLDDLPSWQQEVVRDAERVFASEDWVELPSQFEIDEYDIMRRFARDYPVDSISDELSDALHGHGAFRRFKDTLHRRGIAEEWYAFRQQAFVALAVAWLEENRLYRK